MQRVLTDLLVALALVMAIIAAMYAMMGPARGDGMRQVMPSQSCLMTALQLGYQTGRPDVAHAATEACLAFTHERGAILPYRYPRYYLPRERW